MSAYYILVKSNIAVFSKYVDNYELQKNCQFDKGVLRIKLIKISRFPIMTIFIAIFLENIMKTSSIADAKNNLSQLIHELDSDEPVHLTRYGKPVAVMLSEANYQKLIHKHEGLSQAILKWRTQLDVDCALTEPELKKLRASGQGREFVWEE